MVRTTPYSAIALLVLSACILSCSDAEAFAKKECVLDEHGNELCNPVDLLTTSLRRRGGGKRRTGGPCQKNAMLCWARKVRDYTNEVRRKHNRKALKLGPRAQMNNAMRYANKLSSMGFLRHQSLPSVTREVKCKRFIGGENLAYNYASGDIARACVDQWIKSKGHFENLVRPWFEEVALGVHRNKDGRVYCVQTFGLVYHIGTQGSLKGKNCQSLEGAK